MEETNASTRVLFGNEQEIRERRDQIKSFRSKDLRKFLLGEEYEQMKVITDLMITEGISQQFITDILFQVPDLEYALTYDFLHMAALIMGEEYVRENLLGKTISVKDASRQIREAFYESQMKPYREIYENFEQRMDAALKGEETVRQQVEILKLQSAHAQEMYEQHKKVLQMSHEMEKKDILFQSQKAVEKLEMEKEALTKELSAMRDAFGALRDQKVKMEQETPKHKEGAGPFRRLFGLLYRTLPFLGRKEKQREKEEQRRRLICYQTLAGSEFTPGQLKLLLPCMMDPSIPVSILEKLCQPSLPEKNMELFIRYIKGEE